MIRSPATSIWLTQEDIQCAVERALLRYSVVTPFERLSLGGPDSDEDDARFFGSFYSSENSSSPEVPGSEADSDDDFESVVSQQESYTECREGRASFLQGETAGYELVHNKNLQQPSDSDQSCGSGQAEVFNVGSVKIFPVKDFIEHHVFALSARVTDTTAQQISRAFPLFHLPPARVSWTAICDPSSLRLSEHGDVALLVSGHWSLNLQVLCWALVVRRHHHHELDPAGHSGSIFEIVKMPWNQSFVPGYSASDSEMAGLSMQGNRVQSSMESVLSRNASRLYFPTSFERTRFANDPSGEVGSSCPYSQWNTQTIRVGSENSNPAFDSAAGHTNNGLLPRQQMPMDLSGQHEATENGYYPIFPRSTAKRQDRATAAMNTGDFLCHVETTNPEVTEVDDYFDNKENIDPCGQYPPTLPRTVGVNGAFHHRQLSTDSEVESNYYFDNKENIDPRGDLPGIAEVETNDRFDSVGQPSGSQVEHNLPGSSGCLLSRTDPDRLALAAAGFMVLYDRLIASVDAEEQEDEMMFNSEFAGIFGVQ
ncbi:hypothetical protein ASPZODRAFT_135086 [Penicilliopsis zonata CBS 506.65]|uniref:Uncharacterized protein n=1 Tax=Penicilliopsis zonata CBS 506.65 TaxID=1073090 RepID=A0A1L9SAU4_9EURO|nr:hypothetical protein ASPZODRAFT_135086 [Penicilliopsis zonata CBS 506.65]OJJ44284.1 hypothetical protein ASPZODRAFT_135086 [Penicilliopsis zonata CBS 506.65]